MWLSTLLGVNAQGIAWDSIAQIVACCVERRQVYIEDDHIGLGGCLLLERLQPVARDHHLVALDPQHALNQLDNVTVVVNNQYSHTVSFGRDRITLSG